MKTMRNEELERWCSPTNHTVTLSMSWPYHGFLMFISRVPAEDWLPPWRWLLLIRSRMAYRAETPQLELARVVWREKAGSVVCLAKSTKNTYRKINFPFSNLVYFISDRFFLASEFTHMRSLIKRSIGYWGCSLCHSVFLQNFEKFLENIQGTVLERFIIALTMKN